MNLQIRSLAWSLLVFALLSNPATGAEQIHVGTLTCTLSPSNTEPILAANSELSCHFEAVAGADADFTGIVKRLGVNQERMSKIVLIWSIQSKSGDFNREDLEGRYLGSLKGGGAARKPGAGSLKGGRNGTITLKPLTDNPDIPDSWGISLLELELRPVKA